MGERRSGLRLAVALAVAAAGCGTAPASGPAGSLAGRGSLEYDTVRSPALEGNPPGDPAEREVVVYLPPGYHDSPAARYPVLYLLHGFDGDARQFLAAPFSLPAGLDSLVAEEVIEPMIVVMPDGGNRFGGAFFTNTPAMGRWGDFVAMDLVDRVDAEYRTVAAAEGRGIAGWSMGGFGALALAMRHPERFGVVYALSPCCLGTEMLEDYPQGHPALSEFLSLRSLEEASEASFHARLLFVTAAVLSSGGPRPAGPARPRWSAGTVQARVADNLGALRRLRGIGLDAGSRDAFSHIPITARSFSRALAAAGVPHRFEAYDGTHGSQVPERLRRVVLPFFSARLAGGP